MKMKSFTKLPLYLGLAVLVFAVLISVIKIGDQQAFTTQRTKANVSGASLILKYTAPDLVTVFLTSAKTVRGTDITLKYNSDKITVLSSTLKGGGDFVTSGGNFDKTLSFTFSAIAKKPVSTGVVASFSVMPVKGQLKTDADIQFIEGSTEVYDKASNQNILVDTQGVKFTLLKK